MKEQKEEQKKDWKKSKRERRKERKALSDKQSQRSFLSWAAPETELWWSPSITVWSPPQVKTAMNHSYSTQTWSKRSAPTHFKSALQQSMSGIISHHGHNRERGLFLVVGGPSSVISLLWQAAMLLQNTITQHIRAYKQLFISLKTSINIVM